MPGPPRYIFVADDFTGATDTLATLARTGMAVRLFLDVPEPEVVRDLDAFGIATESRALGTAEIGALMREIGARLASHRPEILHLKICSTFDSAPDTGNFVTAMEALAESTGIDRRAILGGQPSLGRYCVFGHLFARAADGRVHRIDRHPVMRAHPVTPMTESDLGAHVAALGGQQPRLVERCALDAALHWPNDGRTLLLDALEMDDIDRIGAHLRETAPHICAGASSVAEAVAGAAPPRPPGNRSLAAPVLGFAGSRSAVSADQVAKATAYARIAVPPDALGAPEGRHALVTKAVGGLSAGRHVLLSLDASGSVHTAPRELARLSAELVAEIMSRRGVGALVVAGGDTSSAILRRLHPHAIAFEGDIDRGVPLCLAEFDGAPPLPIVLKGGQVGHADLFDDLVGKVFCPENATGT